MLKAEKVTAAEDLAQLKARYQRAFFTNEQRPLAALLADETGTVAIPAFTDLPFLHFCWPFEDL